MPSCTVRAPPSPPSPAKGGRGAPFSSSCRPPNRFQLDGQRAAGMPYAWVAGRNDQSSPEITPKNICTLSLYNTLLI
eukprot:scaffold222637_cov15-Prasinocladus_malaysianus.AAC.1